MSKIILTLACLASFSSPFAAFASAAGTTARDRIVESMPSGTSPAGHEVQIQGIDLVETQMENMGVTQSRQRLDVYVWVRGETKTSRDDVRILDASRTPVSSPAFGGGTAGNAVLVGPDARNPGYAVYRTSFSLADGGARKSERFCVNLSAALKKGENAYVFSNEGRPNDLVHYCK